MMFSCKEVSRLASERLDRELTLRERMAFALHVSMCRNCRRYARQIAILKQATEKLRLRRDLPDSKALSDEARERIAKRLEASHDQDTNA